MKSCSLMLLLVFLLGVIGFLSGVRRMTDLLGDGNGVSANEELPRGSGDDGTDVPRLGGMMIASWLKKEEIEVENDALAVACF